ncbi:MAG TPA: hypothetical protein VLM40_16935, partial [Gemmata sp.]|nr:hypothetical protein [Gemmata sp.]
YGFRPQVPNLRVENLTLHRVHYGVYHPNYDNHFYKNVVIAHSNTEPFNRGHDDDSVQYGLLAVDGLAFDGCRSGGMPLIQITDNNPTGRAVTHMRNVKTINWSDGSRQKALANLGGGPRPTPKTERGVPIYFHDWFGPGRTAMVVSTRSGEFKADPTGFQSEPPLTGDESRVAEVKDIPFPNPPVLVDDLPPATVITSVDTFRRDGRLTVRGVCTDNGEVKRVIVNGTDAKSVAGDFAEWVVVLEANTTRIEAKAEDTAGNVERTPMVLILD